MESDPKRQYFNELAARWDSFESIPDAATKISEYIKRSTHPRPERILDIGCGTGILVPFLIQMNPETQLIVEFDFAEEMLKENAGKFTDPRIIQVHGDARDLPFVVPAFDIILCFNTFPHLGEPRDVLKQLFCCLRTAGILTIGHMSASHDLNNFHGSLDAPVNMDHLLPASNMGKILEELGYCHLVTEEEKDWYFVRGEKS